MFVSGMREKEGSNRGDYKGTSTPPLQACPYPVYPEFKSVLRRGGVFSAFYAFLKFGFCQCCTKQKMRMSIEI